MTSCLHAARFCFSSDDSPVSLMSTLTLSFLLRVGLPFLLLFNSILITLLLAYSSTLPMSCPYFWHFIGCFSHCLCLSIWSYPLLSIRSTWDTHLNIPFLLLHVICYPCLSNVHQRRSYITIVHISLDPHADFSVTQNPWHPLPIIMMWIVMKHWYTYIICLYIIVHHILFYKQTTLLWYSRVCIFLEHIKLMEYIIHRAYTLVRTNTW